MKNADLNVVNDFGEEWSRFEQNRLTPEDFKSQFESYFHIFPWSNLEADAIGADIGCGSGRWAEEVCKRVGILHLIDPSHEALSVAKKKLGDVPNVTFEEASVGKLPFADNSLDFAYCLGVLHHIPDTQAGIREISSKLKVGAPFLIYLYYAFDNRPLWFKTLWRTTDIARKIICRLPTKIKHLVCDLIAFSVYFPITRIGRLISRFRVLNKNWPLYYYVHCSTYVLRTDALDRFGTRLEKRFTKKQVKKMLIDEGFKDIVFSDRIPHWCAIGIKK